MNIHILMHESFEAPGAIKVWAKRNNHNISYTHFYNFEMLPQDFDSFDFLIVMGGPQSPSTTLSECLYFDSKKESAFIGEAISQNKRVLGICLGAQLIGEALGINYGHSPNREIGVFDLTLTEDATDDPIFSTFPKIFPVGHWHGDMPGVDSTTKILATSEGCPRQMVKYTPKVYGFQCHFEFTLESIEGMIKSCSDELEKYKGLPYIQTAETLRQHNYLQINELLFKFLDYMVSID